MNEIKVAVNFKTGECRTYDYEPINNDYNVSKLVFNFDEEYIGRKVVEIRPVGDSKNATFSSEIIDNEVVLVKEENGQNKSIFTKAGQHVIEVHLYNDGSKITATGTRPFNVKEEQINIGDSQATVYLPVFDQMIQELDSGLDDLSSGLNSLNEAITEANNLDLDVSKEGKVATVTLTKKDGTQESVNLIDGEDGLPGRDGTNGQDAKINGVNTLSIVAGENITLSQSGNELEISATGGSGGTSDYDDLTNKPSINNVTLVGNKSLSDLGIQPAGSYATTNDLQTKQNLIDNSHKLSSDLVDDTNNTNKFVTASDKTNWDGKVGFTDYANSTNGTSGVIKVLNSDGFGVFPNNGALFAVAKTYSQYNSGIDTMGISKGTLENVIVGKGLVSNTDFATSSVAGVVRVANNFEISNVNGGAYANILNYNAYTSANDVSFISKGTLENVITGKQLVNKTYVDNLVGDIASAIDLINGEVI